MDVAAAEKDVRRSNPVKLNKTDKIMNVRIKINKKVITDLVIYAFKCSPLYLLFTTLFGLISLEIISLE